MKKNTYLLFYVKIENQSFDVLKNILSEISKKS